MSDDPDTTDSTPALFQLRLTTDADPDDKLELALQLKAAGRTWREIADQCGYTSPDTASVLVHRALQQAALNMSRDRRQQILVLQYQRLEELHRVVYPSALQGDLESIKAALAINDRVVKLLRLDQDDRAATGARDIVIVNRDNMVEAFKEAVFRRDGPDPELQEAPADAD